MSPRLRDRHPPRGPLIPATPPPFGTRWSSTSRKDGQAFFRWDANPEPDLGEYVLQRADSAGAALEAVIRLGASEYRDQYLQYEQTYYYRLQAGDRAGNNSAFTDPVDVTPPNLSSPQRPRGVSARGRNLSRVPQVGITLQWESNAESDLLLYRIYRGRIADFAISDSTFVDSTEAPTCLGGVGSQLPERVRPVRGAARGRAHPASPSGWSRVLLSSAP